MVTAVRITDRRILTAIDAEQSRSGEATATRTAARLITERLAQMEIEALRREPSQELKPTPPAPVRRKRRRPNRPSKADLT